MPAQPPPDPSSLPVCAECRRDDYTCVCADEDVLELRPPSHDADDDSWEL